MASGHGSRIEGHAPVPWSEYDEKWLRRALWFDLYAMWTLLLAGIGFAIWKAWVSAFICFCGALFYLIDLCVQQNRFDLMQLNKPRSTAGLTEWIQLRPWQTEICCACGSIVHLDGALWFPNPVDPGGGRFSIVCPCGIGYFKLKVKAETLV
jgi:hypothetical protein